ncbi:type II toxin-antitoxin system death-on-curing family toxin [Jatrophihabitans endophyticus]|uniref:type II toxin-antitoxin system death-on-curing family toxin n=1 Tax=Jatrophihabitans endophyticus TaxID=1206085 RepID=UPI0019F5A922|nr:type II toxin-antitoxin system death-on-curing family toxin [Jatrophihabitans endophyticus]MBE7189946.1 type II toxin-antitoxin system death-on-curing family toxin [Jatrophihabitans endophyticus]
MTVYLDLDDLMAAAAAALAPSDVLVRDLGLLESALARPQASAFGEDAYPDLLTKAAALLESLARNHALIDGNKRLAWVGMRLFLVLNGTDVRVPSPERGDDFVRQVAQGQLELVDIAHALAEWRR